MELPPCISRKISFHLANLPKTINRNASYVICFKSPRDKTGILHLLLQVYPEKWRRVLRLFLKLTARPFGYFMLDLHPSPDDRFRIWSHLTKRESRPLVRTFDEDIKRQPIRTFRSSI